MFYSFFCSKPPGLVRKDEGALARGQCHCRPWSMFPPQPTCRRSEVRGWNFSQRVPSVLKKCFSSSSVLLLQRSSSHTLELPVHQCQSHKHNGAKSENLYICWQNLPPGRGMHACMFDLCADSCFQVTFFVGRPNHKQMKSRYPSESLLSKFAVSLVDVLYISNTVLNSRHYCLMTTDAELGASGCDDSWIDPNVPPVPILLPVLLCLFGLGITATLWHCGHQGAESQLQV